MGLLEFLEWCEDLHMEPVLGIYAGYSLGGQVVKPGPDLEPYVQEGLEEIEYVTGGRRYQVGRGARARRASGAVQAALRRDRQRRQFRPARRPTTAGYAQFYKAIKAKYPNMQIIATMPVKGMTPDIVDDHYYKREQGMFEEARHYDKTDRNGPKIFVGEWATREGSPTPNFGAALGDAAFMTGMERNSDVVIMSAYAPLFVNVNPGGMQWSFRPDRLRRAEQLRLAELLRAGDVRVLPGRSHAGLVGLGRRRKFFYSVTASPGKLCLKLVNASSTPQPVTSRSTELGAGTHAAHVRNPEGKHDRGRPTRSRSPNASCR